MMTSFYNLLKYAATGQASPDMTYYDRMRASTLMGGAVKTLTGVPPLSFKANGKPLISWSMLGNGQQNGTPAPGAPIYPQFVGERTKNLLDNQMLAEVRRRGVTYTKNADGSVKMFGTASPSVSFCILMGDGAATDRLDGFATPIFKAGEQIIFSTGATELLQIRFTDGTYGNYQDTEPYVPITVRKDIGLVYIQVNNGVTVNKTIYPMIRRADISNSTYEPYGYKLTITNAGQTVPVYLGEVPTVRRVKKLVLDGTENWSIQSQAVYIHKTNFPAELPADNLQTLMCSHFPNGNGAGEMYNGNYYKLIYTSSVPTTVDEWKSYLQQQYSAGTPVTVWYVLANEETTIVNEPLCKIGEYADTLTSEQAGITIPTTDGNNIISVDTSLAPSKMTITGHIKPYTVMTYIDYTDMTKSYTIGDVNKVNAFTQRRKCNMLDDGTITAYYGDPTFVEDGSNGQVMVYQPKFYYKVEPVLLDGIKIRKCKYYISDYQLPGYKLHPAFIDRTDPNNLKEFPFVCIGAYEGCLQNGSTYITDDSASSTSYKLSSIAFTDTATNGVKPSSGIISPFGTIGNYETTASNRGTGWHIENIWIASMNQLMFVIEMCNPNSQTTLGSGVTNIPDTPNTANNSSLVGSTSSLGNGSGRSTTTYSNYNGTTTAQTANGKTAVSYRGMENPFGNIWEWIDGMTIKNTSAIEHVPYICKSFAYTRNSTLTNYDMVNVTIPGNGYVTAFGYDPNFDWLFISAETNSSNTGAIRDYLYTANTGYTCALLGGYWRHGSYAGLFCWYLIYGSGSRYRYISARICYLPQ